MSVVLMNGSLGTKCSGSDELQVWTKHGNHGMGNTVNLL